MTDTRFTPGPANPTADYIAGLIAKSESQYDEWQAQLATLDALLGERLRRAVPVEEYLLAAAAGKVPLPDAEKCRELAHRLGVPEDGIRPHLIAAAPDLYEALEALVDECDRIGSALSEKGIGATILAVKLCNARRAIAKARGEVK